MSALENGTQAVRIAPRITPPSESVFRVLAEQTSWATASELREQSATMAGNDPRDVWVATWLQAMAASRSGDNETARALLTRLMRSSWGLNAPLFKLRNEIAHVLIRSGESDRALRWIRKSMSRPAFATLRRSEQEAWKCQLGRAHRRAGRLFTAATLHREASQQQVPGGQGWLANMSNWLHAEIRADRIEEARAILSQIEALPPGVGSTMSLWVQECCALSMSIELGLKEDSVLHLERLRSLDGTQEWDRFQLLYLNYEADVLLLHGRFAESAARYRLAMKREECRHFQYDLVPCLARGLAESLFGLGECEQAFEAAGLAIRTGARGDQLEQLIGVRIQGQCQWELRRADEARASFIRARALHVDRDFSRERARLEATIARLGVFPIQVPGPDRESDRAFRVSVPSRDRPSPGVRRFELGDGRRFLTLDKHLETELRLAASSTLPVVLEGETGTGKELVARVIHEHGPRAAKPFIVADCTTLPDTLVESELFGAVRGAYTGCLETRDGLVACANGGTLFLDELPELSLQSQAKLLRLLQEGVYRRVGDPHVRRVDIRFIAATNRDLSELVRRRELKPDLFHRLNGHRIHLRSLRERREEIGLIASDIAAMLGLRGIEPAALVRLERGPWPGNVRELEMTIRAAALRSAPGAWLALAGLQGMTQERNDQGVNVALRTRRLEAERAALREALDSHAGNVTAAARTLGMSRQAFYKALARTGGRGSI